jgi:Predicted dehydrogenases and related proteins
MSKKLKIGIIGTGGISNAHMVGYNSLENVEVAAACDINEKRVTEFGEKYNVKKLYTDFNEMLKLEELDGVSICTWNNAHAAATIAALNAGKNVLCEKPMAMNAIEAQKMKDAADKSGKLLMIGFVKRFCVETIICKEYIEKGHIGDIYYAKASYLRRCGNPGGWFADMKRSGGGPLIDLGVHVIDQVRYLMGKPKPVSVSAATFDKIGMRYNVKGIDRYKASDYTDYCDVEDMATAFIRFDNGAILAVDASFSLNIKEDSGNLELFGAKAGAKLEPKLEIYSEMENYLVDISPRYHKAENYFDSIFTNEIKHFTDCIANGTECISPAQDGIELMKILDAAYSSAKTGREVEIK